MQPSTYPHRTESTPTIQVGILEPTGMLTKPHQNVAFINLVERKGAKTTLSQQQKHNHKPATPNSTKPIHTRVWEEKGLQQNQ